MFVVKHDITVICITLYNDNEIVVKTKSFLTFFFL